LYQDQVITTMDVRADQRTVWNTLMSPVQFAESDHLLLRNGVTYPLDMRLADGADGPCLLCHLNNDSTVLRITSMDTLNAFSFTPVTQPAPMREVSFVGELDAPHLHGYFGVDRGEFRLVPIDATRTRIIATTWYHHRIAPAFYWRWWSNHLIDAMHRNVLRGVEAKVGSTS
jgi:hypothetical protein